MESKIYSTLIQQKSAGIKSLAVLIDPDKVNDKSCLKLVHQCIENKVDYLLVGGSLITSTNFSHTVNLIKENCSIPVTIFPGHSLHIDSSADAILFLSLISGRNPDFLIGQHVVAAPILKKSGLEILPTGYILVDAANHTTARYMSNTTPIPRDKPSVAVCTAIAGEMLGLKLVYLDAGSGAEYPVSGKMISAVSKAIEVPLIVGGGLNTAAKAMQALHHGADLIVIGNGIEENPELLIEVSEGIHANNRDLNVHE